MAILDSKLLVYPRVLSSIVFSPSNPDYPVSKFHKFRSFRSFLSQVKWRALGDFAAMSWREETSHRASFPPHRVENPCGRSIKKYFKWMMKMGMFKNFKTMEKWIPWKNGSQNVQTLGILSNNFFLHSQGVPSFRRMDDQGSAPVLHVEGWTRDGSLQHRGTVCETMRGLVDLGYNLC